MSFRKDPHSLRFKRPKKKSGIFVTLLPMNYSKVYEALFHVFLVKYIQLMW